MRVVFVFCLSLFFLLIKGNDGACATRISKANTNVNFGSAPKQVHTSHKHINLHTQKDPSPKETTDVEENEDDSICRIATITVKQVVSFGYALLLTTSKTPKKLALPYCEHLSYTSSFKYLLLRVFRI